MAAAPSGTDEVDLVVDEIGPAVNRGECILFLGAGIHAGPPEGSPWSYPVEERPMSAPALSERLAEKAGFRENAAFANESTRNLRRTSLYYEMKKTRAGLINELTQATQTGKQPSPLLHALAALDFRVVMTTNYDRLFEAALGDAGKTPNVAIYNKERVSVPPLEMPQPLSPTLLKLHGDISRPDSVVVTDEDYIDFILRMNDPLDINPLPLDVRFFFQKYTTLFIGYSLLDYNLRVLFRAMRWKVDQAQIPLTYALDLQPDPLIVDVWWNQRRYVQFVAADAWAFVPSLYAKLMGHEMPQ